MFIRTIRSRLATIVYTSTDDDRFTRIWFNTATDGRQSPPVVSTVFREDVNQEIAFLVDRGPVLLASGIEQWFEHPILIEVPFLDTETEPEDPADIVEAPEPAHYPADDDSDIPF